MINSNDCDENLLAHFSFVPQKIRHYYVSNEYQTRPGERGPYLTGAKLHNRTTLQGDLSKTNPYGLGGTCTCGQEEPV